MAKLGQILISRGWINLPQLTRALKTQGVVAGRLGTCLMEMDALSEENLGKALAEQTGLPIATLEQLRAVPDEVIGVLPSKIARRCRAVPFQLIGNRLDVAMLDPRNLSCHDEVAFASGRRVRVHVAPEVRIFEALERYYSEECPSRFTLLLDRLNRARYLWKEEEKDSHRDAEATNPPPPPVRNRERAPLGLDRFPDLPILGGERTAGPMLDLPVAPPKGGSGLFPLVRPIGSSGPPNPHGASTSALRPSERGERKAPEVPSVSAPLSAPALLKAKPAAPPAAPARSTGANPAAPHAPTVPRVIPLTAEERADLERLERPPEEAPTDRVGKGAAQEAKKTDEARPAAPSPPPRREPPPAMPPRVAAPPAPRPAPATVEELAQALAATTERDVLAELVVDFLARRFDRAAAFQVARGQVSGWRARGKDVDPEAFAKYRVGLDQPSVFLNLDRGSGLHLGPLPPMPAHLELAKCWGGALPQRAMMLPIRIGERLVAVLYADGEDKSWNGFGIDVQNRLRSAFTGALEGCIRKRRGLGA